MGYYIANKGVQEGPFELTDLPQRGLREDSLVWADGMPDWKRADAVPEVAALLQPSAPAAPLESAPDAVLEPAPAPIPPVYTPQQMLPYQTPPANPNNGMAVASLVLGIVSYPISVLYCAGVIPALLAVIFGFIARGKIKRGETTVGGGMALAGIILGFVQLGLILLLICLFAIGIGFAAVHSKP